jgi:hypothetical protein
LRGGVNTIGKQHFILLYSKARDIAFTPRNIKSAWSKAGLYKFCPDKVLRDIQRPPAERTIRDSNIDPVLLEYNQPPQTPVTSEAVAVLRRLIENDTHILDHRSKAYVQKLGNATEQAFAHCSLLSDQVKLLLEQNNEKTIR